MIVCICHQVSDRDITRRIQAGADFSDIQLELGVATQCGRCEPCARDVVRESQVPNPCHGGPDAPFPTWSLA